MLSASSRNAPPSYIGVVGGASREALVEAIDRLRCDLARVDVQRALIEAATLAKRSPHRLGLVGSSRQDLEAKMAFAAEKLRHPECHRIREPAGIYYTDVPLAERGSLAVLFPGEGSQYAGMLEDLCALFPEARRGFDLIDRAFASRRGIESTSRAVFSARGNGPNDRLWEMDQATEAVFAANCGLFALLQAVGLRADAVAGHSTGDYAALLAGGAIDVTGDTELITHLRSLNEVYEQLSREGRIAPGVLLAVAAPSRAQIRQLLADGSGLQIALDNCPHQLVLCGTDAEVEAAMVRLRDAGIMCERLPFERAYHTPLFEAFCGPVRDFFDGLPIRQPRITTYSCATAAPYPVDADAIRDVAASQWARPVRFTDTIERMYGDGVRIFVESGPRGSLTGFVNDILGKRPHLAVATNVVARPGLAQLHHALAQLVSHGVDLSIECVMCAPDTRSVRTPSPPKRSGVAMPIKLGLPVLRIATASNARAHVPPTGGDGHTEALRAHFKTMRRFLEVQREVMCEWARGDQADAEPTGHNDETATAAALHDLSTREVPPELQPTVEVGSQQELLLSIVSEKTGYPAEMIDLAADIEADYGIDSIKRVEILGTFLRRLGDGRVHDLEHVSQMRSLGAILQALSDALLGQTDGSAPSMREGAGPLLRDVASRGENEVTATLVLDPRNQAFLQDHTLGRRISVFDEELRGLPVLPFAISLELMAEAARALVDARPMTRIRNVSISRWITARVPDSTLEVRASRGSVDATEVTVKIFERSESAGPLDAPAIEGIVCFDPDVPQLQPLLDTGQLGASTWKPDRLYVDGLFNGPAFQSITSIDGVSDDAIRATLRVPAASLFPDSPDVCRADPVVVDGAGQAIGFWASERLSEGFVIFPTGVEEVLLQHGPLPPRASASCTARVSRAGSHTLRSDIEVVDAEGNLRVRLAGWQDRRLAISRSEAQFVLDPVHTILSERCDGLSKERSSAAVRCCRVGPGTGALEGFGQVGLDVLAHIILGASERAAWLDSHWSLKRRTEWLRGRLAAKDAVRSLVEGIGGLAVAPADILIGVGSDGHPIVSGRWVDELGWAPLISISHCDGVAMALAADARQCSGIGIDFETLNRVNAADVERVAFGAAERDLLPSATEQERHEWVVRFWAARESATKALAPATGAPTLLSVDGFELGSGCVRVRWALPGAALGRPAQDTIPVHTTRQGDGVVAVAILEGEA